MKSNNDYPYKSKVSVVPPNRRRSKHKGGGVAFIGDGLVDETDNLAEVNTDIDVSADP
jgi:hypothetical protein